jgi:hypothetical protein
VESLDDDKDGLLDESVWQTIAENAARQVDARLGKRYPVPFSPLNLEPIVSDASLTFVLETLYTRRGFGTAVNNPFLTAANQFRSDLLAIGNGQTPLTPEARKPRPSVVTFTEPSRTHSAHGNLSC